MKRILFLYLLGTASLSSAQSRFSPREFSINGFRNPSIGLEYRMRSVSVHGGYYPTNFSPNTTTSFLKAGATIWFLPVGKRENPSSFYTSISYLRGLDRDYKNVNAAMLDAGFRWMVWQGLNLRIGIAAVAAPDRSLKLNPTPGIGYSFFF